MKKLLLFLLFLATPAYAIEIDTAVIGTMWKQEGTVVSPADDVTEVTGVGISEGSDVTFGNMTATKIITTLSGSSSDFNLSAATGILTLKGTSVAAVNSSGNWGYILNATDFTLYGSRKLGFAAGNSAPDVKLIRDSAGILKITDGDSALGDLILGDIEIVGAPSFSGWTTVTGDYTVDSDIFFIECDATLGNISTTLPPIAGVKRGRMLEMKLTSATNGCYFDGNGAETIDGAAGQSITTQYNVISLIAGATEWLIR